jgi:diguanylate cyclase (GGDEF)-like protein/PAS domain S-box-containing protein
MMLSAPFSGLLSYKNADSLSVAAFETHIRQLCDMMQNLLHAGKVSFWLLHSARNEVICLQDIPNPERIGLSLPLSAISAIGEALSFTPILEISDAHLDDRLRNTPIGCEPVDIILARVVYDDEVQGVLVCRKEDQSRAWPINNRALINNFVELAAQGLLMLHPDAQAWRHLLWQQHLHKLTYQLTAKTGQAFFSELVSQLAIEIGASAVWIGELQQVGHGTASIRVIAGFGATTSLEHFRYPLQESSCRLLYLADDWILQSQPDVPMAIPAKPAWLIAVPLRKNKEHIIGHIAFTFAETHPEPSELIRALHSLLARAEAELIRYQTESVLRLSSVAFDTNKGCIITDPTFTILRINQAFTDITGISSEQAIGCQLGKEIWTISEAQSVALNHGLHWRGEIERKRRSGETYPQWETWTPVHDEINRLSHYVISVDDLTERVRSSQRIEALAYYDELTGLANRRRLLEQVNILFEQAKIQDEVGALLFIDLDHFKDINDSLGHAAGDWVLQQVAERLKPFFAKEDELARLGGDEFVALLPGLSCNPPQAEMHATRLAERIIDALSAPYYYSNQILHLGASVGMTLYPTRDQTPADLLKQADTAMYQAKAAGRGTVRAFDAAMQRKVDKRLRIHNQLRDALRNNELSLHYQPQHMVSTGELIGAEALIRWQPPQGGIISPIEFIPIAEETDLIIDIGQWVMIEACHQFMHWYAVGIKLPQLSVNVSAKQFHHARFTERVYEVLDKTGMLPEALNLEITESVVLEGLEDTIQKMTELKSIGISFSIDDFGTGYSSLGYLTRLPVDELKIDRTFIKGIPNDVSNMAIAEAVLAMARHLGFNVTAEGVETRQQLQFLKQQSCHFYQGYLASKPLPADVMAVYAANCLNK